MLKMLLNSPWAWVWAFWTLQLRSFTVAAFSSASSKSSSSSSSVVRPIDPSGWPDRFPAKDHCSKCGLCETSYVKNVVDACAFLNDGMSRMDQLEEKVHGRRRNLNSFEWKTTNNNTIDATKKDKAESSVAEEARFGVMHEPMRLARGVGMQDAQWTGVVTSIALSMLESNRVDAVVSIAASETDKSSWSVPEPILAKTPKDVLRGRGVKPALAASLNVLDQIQNDPSIQRLLFCGVGCAVQAFRSIQDSLNLKEIYVLGTNCVDNSPTPAAAERFLREGFQLEASAGRPNGYEFMQDFKVHVKTDQGYFTKPYISLPGTIAEPSIATSCLACSDYTNGLADVVVGYMGAPLDAKSRMDQSLQTLTIRNPRGATMVETARQAGRLQVEDIATGRGSHEKMTMSTVQSDSIVQKMVGGKVAESGLPLIFGEILAFILTKFVAPTGVTFARYSIDYHLLRNYLHMLDAWGEERTQQSMPQFAREIVNYYLHSDPQMKMLQAKVLERSTRPR